MRDFTINALLYDPADQSVLDFVGGVPDLTNRVLRGCVDAEARLLDDPIRVLRCVLLQIRRVLGPPLRAAVVLLV
jgi:poly(A) polymerase